MVAQVGDFAEAAVAYVAPAEKGGGGGERCGQQEKPNNTGNCDDLCKR